MVFIKMQYMQIALFAVSDLCVVYKGQDWGAKRGSVISWEDEKGRAKRKNVHANVQTDTDAVCIIV